MDDTKMLYFDGLFLVGTLKEETNEEIFMVHTMMLTVNPENGKPSLMALGHGTCNGDCRVKKAHALLTEPTPKMSKAYKDAVAAFRAANSGLILPGKGRKLREFPRR